MKIFSLVVGFPVSQLKATALVSSRGDGKTLLPCGWWVRLPVAARWEFLAGCSLARVEEILWIGNKGWV